MSRKPTVEQRSAAERVAHSVGHPMRIDALAVLQERTASPKEIADELGVTVNKVSFHVKELQRAGCIELVRTEPRRGAVEHYYRALRPPRLSEREWAELDPEGRAEAAALSFQVVVAEGLATLRGAGDVDVASEVLRLDERGRRELAAAQDEARARARRIGEEAAARLERSGGEGSVVFVSQLRFRRPR